MRELLFFLAGFGFTYVISLLTLGMELLSKKTELKLTKIEVEIYNMVPEDEDTEEQQTLYTYDTSLTDWSNGFRG